MLVAGSYSTRVRVLATIRWVHAQVKKGASSPLLLALHVPGASRGDHLSRGREQRRCSHPVLQPPADSASSRRQISASNRGRGSSPGRGAPGPFGRCGEQIGTYADSALVDLNLAEQMATYWLDIVASGRRRFRRTCNSVYTTPSDRPTERTVSLPIDCLSEDCPRHEHGTDPQQSAMDNGEERGNGRQTTQTPGGREGSRAWPGRPSIGPCSRVTSRGPYGLVPPLSGGGRVISRTGWSQGPWREASLPRLSARPNSRPAPTSP